MGKYERTPIHQYDTPTNPRKEERRTAIKSFLYLLGIVVLVTVLVGAFIALERYNSRSWDWNRIDRQVHSDLSINPEALEQPCDTICSDGLVCMDQELQACPCEHYVEVFCIEYPPDCSCRNPKKK